MSTTVELVCAVILAVVLIPIVIAKGIGNSLPQGGTILHKLKLEWLKLRLDSIESNLKARREHHALLVAAANHCKWLEELKRLERGCFTREMQSQISHLHRLIPEDKRVLEAIIAGLERKYDEVQRQIDEIELKINLAA